MVSVIADLNERLQAVMCAVRSGPALPEGRRRK